MQMSKSIKNLPAKLFNWAKLSTFPRAQIHSLNCQASNLLLASSQALPASQASNLLTSPAPTQAFPVSLQHRNQLDGMMISLNQYIINVADCRAKKTGCQRICPRPVCQKMNGSTRAKVYHTVLNASVDVKSITVAKLARQMVYKWYF